jgi:hypothetical protein
MRREYYIDPVKRKISKKISSQKNERRKLEVRLENLGPNQEREKRITADKLKAKNKEIEKNYRELVK